MKHQILVRLVTLTLISVLCAGSVPGQTVPLDTTGVFIGHQLGQVNAMAWGDVDGDGDLDLALAQHHPYVGPRVYINDNGTFLDPPMTERDSVTGYNNTNGVAWGDFDGDGDLDLACGNENGPDVIYINDHGVLENVPGWISSTTNDTYAVAWGDVDNDGDLDLVCGSGAYGGPNLLYLNEQGSIDTLPSWSSVYPYDDITTGLFWGDINGDGFLDLVCEHSYIIGNYPSIYFNHGGILDTLPGWRPAFIQFGVAPSGAVALGDIDGDGDLDLAVCDNNLCVFYNHDGVLEDTASWVGWGLDPGSAFPIAFGDVDGDGDLDLACGTGAAYHTLRVFLNLGDSLESVASWVVTDADDHRGVAWADVDGDGDLDLTVGGHTHPSQVYINHSSIIDTLPGWYSGDTVRAVDWVDIDNDGDMDLAYGVYDKPDRIFYQENGALEPTARWQSELTDSTISIGFADIDGDGYPEMACGNYQQPAKLYSNAGGVLETSPDWTSSNAPRYGIWSVAFGDVNGDGYPDLALGISMDPSELYMNASGVLQSEPSWMPDLGLFSRTVAWADVDLDGDLDLASAENNARVRIYSNTNGILETTASWQASVSTWTIDIDWGDINGDGYLDLACGNTRGERDAVYLNRGGTLETSPAWVSPEDKSTTDIELCDFDQDGDLDLAAHWWYNTEIFPNNGGQLAIYPDYFVVDSSYSGACLAWGDADGDGDMDLAIGGAVYYNHMRSFAGDPRTTNAVTYLASRGVEKEAGDNNLFDISFVVVDRESDRCRVEVEYSTLGGGLWLPATILDNNSGLESSPQGTLHVLTWDADADGVDGYNVWIRLRVFSNPDRCGIIQWPAWNYNVRVGRIYGRPRIALQYPRQYSAVIDSLPVLGRIWDATNFSDYRILRSQLPDTVNWEEVFSSLNPVPRPELITTLDVSAWSPGDYIVRTIANDQRGAQSITDKYITVNVKPAGAPSVINCFPCPAAANVPGNAPVVVQFDTDIHQPAINSETFNLTSESGERYTDALYEFSSRTLTIKPVSSYTESSFYYAVVDDQVPSLSGVAMGGEFVSGFTTSNGSPTSTIDSLYPFRGQVQTPVNQSLLAVYFNTASLHRYVTVFSLAGDTVVNDTITDGWSPGTVPVSGLLPKTYYLVRISDSPTFDGESDYMSYFITEDTEMPVIVDHTPANNAWLVGLEDEIRVTFNKPLNVFSVDSSSFYVLGPHGQVPGLFDFGVGEVTEVTFSSDKPYEAGAAYTVILTPHVQDNLGNNIGGLSWSFTTGYFDTVGYDGDRLTTDGLTLRFPRGAFASEVEIGVGRIPAGVLSPPVELAFTGLAYDIEAAQTPGREVVLSVLLPDTLRSQPVMFYRYDAGAGSWEHVGGTLADGSLEASVTELGRYGVFIGEPAAVEVTDFASSVSLIPRVISPRRGGANGELQVAYRLSVTTPVVAKVYDTRGQLVTTLMDGESGNVGENLMTWDGRRRDGGYANDGLYVLVIEVDNEIVRKTFVILNR